MFWTLIVVFCLLSLVTLIQCSKSNRSAKSVPNNSPTVEVASRKSTKKSPCLSKETEKPSVRRQKSAKCIVKSAKSTKSPSTNNEQKVDSLSPDVASAMAQFVKSATATTSEKLNNVYRLMVDVENNNGKTRPTEQTSRQSDIPCNEETRVVLVSEDSLNDTKDFLHANWIEKYRSDRDYIIAQAPAPAQLNLFWRMILQESCSAIVCLGPFITDCVVFSHKDETTGHYRVNSFGTTTIETKKVEEHDGFVVYTIHILHKNSSEPSITQLISYGEWEDNMLPENGEVILKIRKFIKSLPTGPVCLVSAKGIGRAGCFALVDRAISKLDHGDQLEMAPLLRQIRQQRCCAVERAKQFVFCYTVVLQYIANKYERQAQEIHRIIKDF